MRGVIQGLQTQVLLLLEGFEYVGGGEYFVPETQGTYFTHPKVNITALFIKNFPTSLRGRRRERQREGEYVRLLGVNIRSTDGATA